MLTNIPEVKLGIIAVSRDCFIIDLSELRRSAVAAACKGQGIGIYECPVTVENEKDMLKAVEDVKSAGCNALVVFLGTFGPRPQDFFACNAPIKGLYEIGVEIEENSELDLLVAYKAHANAPRIPEVCADMAKEMGEGRYYPELNQRMAQLELTLLDWTEGHKGSRQYVAFADKCWPAFPEAFGFEPCYVNSRLVSRGIPVSCEVDIYGALSEYIGMCVSGDTVTLLDINNSVYRLQCDSEGQLRAYIAQGEVLPVKPRSFGGIGVFAIPEMGRFYRHVLIQKRYPHHGAVAFGHYGKALFEVFKFLGIQDIAYNQPKNLPYSTENPFV